MRQWQQRAQYVVLSITVITAMAVGGLSGAVSAETSTGYHAEDQELNVSVFPMDTHSHQPGVDDGNYTLRLGPSETEGPHFGELENSVLTLADGFEVASEYSCAFDTAGIDRGGNNSRTETDEEVAHKTKDYEIGPERIFSQFYTKEDFGEHLEMRPGDQFVAELSGCWVTPDEPGWYRWHLYQNGTAPDEETFIEAESESHYIWICECESEDEAREQLGPPPHERSEETPTAETGATPTSTAASNDGGESGETDTPTATATPTAETGATPTPTSTAASNDGGESGETDTPTATDNHGGAADGDTPAVDGDGAGFGPLVAVIALLSAALVVARRAAD